MIINIQLIFMAPARMHSHKPHPFAFAHAVACSCGGHRAVRLNSARASRFLYRLLRGLVASAPSLLASTKHSSSPSPHIAPIPGAYWRTTSCARMMNIELRILIYDL